jgi:hypothetical protein
MTAGIKTLEILDRPGAYEHLDHVTKRLVVGLEAAAKQAGHAFCASSISGGPRPRLHLLGPRPPPPGPPALLPPRPVPAVSPTRP